MEQLGATESGVDVTDAKALLSWSRILDVVRVPSIAEHYSKLNTVFTIPRSDPLYCCYSECLQHLQETYGNAPLSPSTMDDLCNHHRKAAILPPAFGILVNAIADRRPDLRFLDTTASIPVSEDLQVHSMVDFVLAGIIAITPLKYYVVSALQESQERSKADVFQALFLDYMNSALSHERNCIRSAAVWSPMPWSRISLKISSELRPNILDGSVTDTLSLHKDVSFGYDTPKMRRMRLRHGSLVDIPWLDAAHDGFLHCSDLSSYTRARRARMTPSFREDAALWLGAMTFGVLEAVTHSRIPESMLLVPGTQGGRVLSGARILNTNPETSAHSQRGREIAQILDLALRALEEEAQESTDIFHRAGLSEHISRDILCAVGLMLMVIDAFVHTVWGELPEAFHAPSALSVMQTSCGERMRRAGWCPNTISTAFLSRFSTFANFVNLSNLLQLPPFIRTHIDEHKGCTEAACVFHTFTEDSYVRRHVHPSCDCEYTKPPLDDVLRLLSEGIVPVIVYDGEKLHVRPANSTAYVAISHVWADGMGSNTEVGMPTCVVARLAALARTLLPDSGALWLDSLCVPERKAPRKLALRLMAKSYQDAAKVLVIEECIRTQCSLGKPWEENLFRIRTSGWLRRVWTLQEGLLARELYFEFTDGVVDVEEHLALKSSAKTATGPPENGTPGRDSSRLYHRMVPALLAFRARDQSVKAGRPIAVHEVVELLQLRSTTKAEDEIIAISSLLPLNVDTLLAIGGPDAAQGRMKEFLLQTQQASRGLPMTRGTPRLTLPGYTWAPRALAAALDPTCYHWGMGTCTANGLLAEYFVAMFQQPVFVVPSLWDGWLTGRYTPASAQSDSDSEPVQFTLAVEYQGVSTEERQGLVPISIDGLLFCNKSLSDDMTSCAAVRKTGVPQTANTGSSPQTPLRLSFLGPCSLFRQTSSALFSPTETVNVSFAELCREWVLLG
ncbi:hypothetical protein C8Q78DRAFT_50871 [Trametes maxima]|nr:hypothetical protein C8Q78DRAFT_50871 [Trametes maxima]